MLNPKRESPRYFFVQVQSSMWGLRIKVAQVTPGVRGTGGGGGLWDGSSMLQGTEFLLGLGASHRVLEGDDELDSFQHSQWKSCVHLS